MAGKFLVYIFLGFTIISCGTSKNVKDLMASDEYGIKKVHIENRNSSYDKLAEEYLASLESEDSKLEKELAKDTLMHLSKRPCLGHCPVYSVTFYNNGRVKYDGVVHVDMLGIYESKLSETQKSEALALIEKVDLIRMSSRYPLAVEMATDVARTSLVISNGSVKFDTTIAYGEPDALKDLQEYITRLVEELSWVQI